MSKIAEALAAGLGGAAIGGLASAAKDNAQAKKDISQTGYLNNTDGTPTTGQSKSYHEGGLVGKGGGTVEEGEVVIPKHVVNKVGRMAKSKGTSIYRAMHHLRHGGLHRALGVPESETIPKDKIEAATHSNNEHVMHMANMAQTMAGFKK